MKAPDPVAERSRSALDSIVDVRCPSTRLAPPPHAKAQAERRWPVAAAEPASAPVASRACGLARLEALQAACARACFWGGPRTVTQSRLHGLKCGRCKAAVLASLIARPAVRRCAGRRLDRAFCSLRCLYSLLTVLIRQCTRARARSARQPGVSRQDREAGAAGVSAACASVRRGTYSPCGSCGKGAAGSSANNSSRCREACAGTGLSWRWGSACELAQRRGVARNRRCSGTGGVRQACVGGRHV